MSYITYKELLIRYGKAAAHDMLLLIERSANGKSNLIHMNPETRLERALDALNDNIDTFVTL